MSETGALGADSMFVRFNFTRDELFSACASRLEATSSGNPGEMPAELKTYVHELTHYVQYTTTPYGLFLHYCRILQNLATIALAQTLLSAEGGFKMPLLENIPKLSGENRTSVWNSLALWLNMEDLIASLAADEERRDLLADMYSAEKERVRSGLPSRLPPLVGFRETFARVQSYLAILLEAGGKTDEPVGNEVPAVCPISLADQEAIGAELTEATGLLPAQDRADLRLHVGIEIFGIPWNVGAVIESAATAAEFWGTNMTYDQFATWADASTDPHLQPYRICISQGLRTIPSHDLSSVIPSYLALCELALTAPLLPNHAALRREKPDFRQMLPTLRWLELMRAAGKVHPMNGLTDHGRYVAELCHSLDWVYPQQIAGVAVDGPEVLGDPLCQIYAWGQRARAQRSGEFIGLDRHLIVNNPAASTWRDHFNFVVLDYADRTTYHRNKDFLEAMTTRSLEMLGLHRIMLGKGRKFHLVAPYRGDPAEHRWMTEWLQARFKELFGREFPMLRVVASD